jgi:TatD DNase family protein
MELNRMIRIRMQPELDAKLRIIALTELVSTRLSSRRIFTNGPGNSLAHQVSIFINFAKMKLIDTHTHLYLPEFDSDSEAVVARAIKAGVERMYLPNVDSETIESMHRLESKFPDNCFAMMGLHPCSVSKETIDSELIIVEEWFNKRAYPAVGEIGLDLYWDKNSFEIQVEALRVQCNLALKYNIPVVLHSREATGECIKVISEFVGLRGVFHCFSGSSSEAKAITEMGFYLGIGGVLTYKKSTLPDSIQDIPLEFLVLETDSPYLSPVPFRGKRNESSYIRHVLDCLSEQRMIGRAELAEVTTNNALKLFAAHGS